MKFRRKAIEVEAYQVVPRGVTTDQPPPPWLIDALLDGTVTPISEGGLLLATQPVPWRADVGDYLVRDSRGTLSIYHPTEFEEAFEAVVPAPEVAHAAE